MSRSRSRNTEGMRHVTAEGTYEPMRTTPTPIEERYARCIIKLACEGAELEPLRRVAGVCAPCMRERMKTAVRVPLEEREAKAKASYGRNTLPRTDPRRKFNVVFGKGLR